MTCHIMLLEDEPIILMDLEFAAEDAGFTAMPARTLEEGLALAKAAPIDVAILDVNLGGGKNCAPVAKIFEERGIPYLLHSGDLDRQNELVRNLNAELIPKPAPAELVIARAAELSGRQRLEGTE